MHIVGLDVFFSKAFVHPVKSINKRKVLDLIEKNWTSGFKQNDIIEKTKLTKPTVYHILNEIIVRT